MCGCRRFGRHVGGFSTLGGCLEEAERPHSAGPLRRVRKAAFHCLCWGSRLLPAHLGGRGPVQFMHLCEVLTHLLDRARRAVHHGAPVRYQQSRVFSGHDVKFVFCVCFHVKIYVWYKSLHKNNVTIEAHWLHTFPLHLSFVASRLRPPLSTTPRTVAPAHQTRRDGLLHQTGYKAKGLLRCLECVQQRGPRRGYGALLPSRRRRLRSREDCHRKKGKATPFVLCTIISGVSVFRVRVERSI